MAAKKKGKTDNCGGKKCGACKACCDVLKEINDELKICASQNKVMMAKLRAENKALLASEVSLKETEVSWKETEGALRGKIDDLVDERDQLNLNLLSSTMKKKKNGSGRWLIRHMSGEDRPAQEVVSTIVKEVLFPNMKDMPAGWEEYDEDPDTICGMIMGRIIVPDGKSKEEYWLETVREAVNYKFGQLKRQASNKLKKKVSGE